MMCGAGNGFLLGALLGVFLILGFSYIVWVLSSKESGIVKIMGQIVSLVIAIIIISMFVLGSFGGYGRGRGMGYGRNMDKMEKCMEENNKMMKEMQKTMKGMQKPSTPMNMMRKKGK